MCNNNNTVTGMLPITERLMDVISWQTPKNFDGNCICVEITQTGQYSLNAGIRPHDYRPRNANENRFWMNSTWECEVDLSSSEQGRVLSSYSYGEGVGFIKARGTSWPAQRLLMNFLRGLLLNEVLLSAVFHACGWLHKRSITRDRFLS
jgi:hypothetical protein